MDSMAGMFRNQSAGYGRMQARPNLRGSRAIGDEEPIAKRHFTGRRKKSSKGAKAMAKKIQF